MNGSGEGRPVADAPGGTEPFVDRWSRLKRAAAEETQDGPSVEPPAEAAPPSAALTDRDMPPVEDLSADSDYTPFLSPKVSEPLRRLALRKLFHSDDFNVCDGLDDYAEDFTRFAGLAGLVTAEMKHRLQRLLDAEQAEMPVADSGPGGETVRATGAERFPPRPTTDRLTGTPAVESPPETRESEPDETEET